MKRPTKVEKYNRGINNLTCLVKNKKSAEPDNGFPFHTSQILVFTVADLRLADACLCAL